MGERTSVLQTAQPRRFQPPVTSTAAPIAIGWGDLFASGFSQHTASSILMGINSTWRKLLGQSGQPEQYG
jgi:hypothetical protein